MVKIIIDSKILLHDNIRFYCPHNAATNSIRMQTSRGELTAPDDMEAMFGQEVKFEYRSFNRCGVVKRHRASNLKNNVPTSQQAEILYQGIIEPQYIKKIVTTEDPSDKLVSMLKERGIAYCKGKIYEGDIYNG